MENKLAVKDECGGSTNVAISVPHIPRQRCNDHDLTLVLLGYPCPRCKRRSLFTHEYTI